MAAGDTILELSPLMAEFPSTTGAARDVRNSQPVLDFDATLDESAMFSAVMPQHYAGGTLGVYLHTSYSTATADSAVWQGAFERIGDGALDTDTDSFATGNAITVAVPDLSGKVTVDAITFGPSEVDGVQAGELFRLKISRLGSTGADDATGDGELKYIEIREA